MQVTQIEAVRKQMDPQIDIVIVNWNAGVLLRRCVESVLYSEEQEKVGVIAVVDNASTDGSCQHLPEDGRVSVVRNAENKGFAFACNQGIALCKSNFVVMLNPDVMLNGNTLSQSLAYMQTHPELDILGCMQLDDAGNVKPSCSRFPTPTRFFYDALGLPKLLPAVFKPATLMTDWDHLGCRYVDQIMGSYMFIRSSVFHKVGLFDTRYFVYFEELDLSKRLADCGGKSFYNHQIQLVHTGEGTTQKVKAFRLLLNLNSRLHYAEKHFGKAGYIFTWFITMLLEPITRVGFCLLRLKPSDAKDTIKGFSLLWKKRMTGK